MIYRFEFVTHVPDKMEADILYISIPFSTVLHLCPCGCGNEVVTKISPSRWKLMFDGETVSLSPSIGNWYFPCQSHYWIKENRIIFVRERHDEKKGTLKKLKASLQKRMSSKKGKQK